MTNDQATQLATTSMQISADVASRKKAFERAKKLMREQRDLDLETWRLQNAYNTPLAQMERLKEAGLNPALMYGQGNTGNANSSVQSKFQELTPFTDARSLASSTAAGVQMSLANAQRANIEADTTYKAIKGATETGQLEVARGLADSQIELQSQKVEESKQSIIESKDRVLTGKANREQIYSAIKNDVMNRMQTFANITLTNTQIKQTEEATKQIMTNTRLAQQMFNMDYSDLTGKNWMVNFEKLAKGAYPKDTMIGGASILSTLMIARNPMAVLGPAGKGGKVLTQLAKKNTKKLNTLIKQAKAWINWKLGRPGGFPLN